MNINLFYSWAVRLAVAAACAFGIAASYGRLEAQSLSASSPAKEYIYSGGSMVAVRQFGNEGPTVSLSVMGGFDLAPATVSLTATATDADGVANVKFYRDGTLIATDSMSPFAHTWNSAPAGSYKWTAEATDNAGFSNYSNPVYVSITPSTGTEWSESGGLVEIEAEDGEIINRDQSWVLRTDVSHYGGSGFLRAETDTGISNAEEEDYWGESPEVTYAVDFTTTGTYYVWIRGLGTGSSDDSVHVGLDGVPLPSSNNITGFDTTNDVWTWSSSTSDGPRATITVATAGTHQLNVWMREDGFRLDRILLVNDENYIPVFQAENATYVSGTDSDYWGFDDTTAGFEGTGYMRALDDDGTSINTSYVGVSPELKGTTNFPFSGGQTYYVWVRAYTTGSGDDSVHAGFNGQASANATRISGFTHNQWSWSSTTIEATRARITGVTAGAKAVNLWMREDGIRVDKIFVTKDVSYTPN